jgi:hypothetical protein
MSIIDCLLENLPLTLAAIGIVLLGIVIAAVILVAVTFTGGTAAAFAAAVVAQLAAWWVSIAVSVIGTLVLAYQICAEQAENPQIQITAGAIVGISVALTAVALSRRISKLE